MFIASDVWRAWANLTPILSNALLHKAKPMIDSDLRLKINALKTDTTSWEQANVIAHRALVEAIASRVSPGLIFRLE